MKEDTKTRILERGAEIIHLKGFNHTGVQEILRAAGVPKGSFYNYFKSKEDFGLQVIDYFMDFFSNLAAGTLGDHSLPPLERIRNLLSWFVEFFKSKDFAYGCPIGNLAQEMGDLSPAFREKLKQGLDAMVSLYAEVLAEAQESGDLAKGLDVREAAYFLVYSWHGALMHMKAVKGPAPLENHLKSIFTYVLSS
jgi:TetR/AcrR family transcriptional regulator, transcriptional repressor for nem operon